IAYWTAYMKANYPVEFMTALLTAELQGVAGPMREIKMAQTLEECRKMEIKVLPPDINKSDFNFKIEDGSSIRFGLSAIKNVGQAAIESVIQAREGGGSFKGFKEFLYRVELRKVNKKTVESLIKADAFYQFGNRATLLTSYPVLVKEVSDMKAASENGQFGLFGGGSKEEQLRDTFEKLTEFDEDLLFSMEKEVIGFLINKNPLLKFKNLIAERATKLIGEVTNEDLNKAIILVGIVSGKKLIKTKRDNSEMAFITLFDESGSIECVVFPSLYKKFAPILAINQVLICKGKVTEKEDRLSYIIEAIQKLS
ncbi:MAG: OB-fold nucleic acid binding domain-containing protein, partial [Patescibacteria group bacterium]